MLPDLARHRSDVEGVELDQITRPLNGPGRGLAHRIGPLPTPLADAHPTATDRLAQLARAAKPGEDPSDHRDRQDHTFPPKEHPELVLAPARIGLADRADRMELGDRPGRPASPMGSRRAVLEGLEPEAIEPAEPAVDGRSGHPEVAGGQADVGTVLAMPVDHREASASLARETRGDRSRLPRGGDPNPSGQPAPTAG